MALDGAFLYAVKKEIEMLKGARIDRIHQPSKEEIIISFRAKSGNYKLLMSASANSARVHITNSNTENPKAPPMFCMLLRKHLGGGKLKDIRQDGLERILYFDFEAMNEIGDMVTVTVACEIMGRYSNIILINSEGRVIDSVKRVDAEMSRERPILPGIRYETPPRVQRISILNPDENEIRSGILNLSGSDASKSLVRTFEGLSPIFARECIYYASGGRDICTDDINDDIADRAVFYLKNAGQNLMIGNNCYNIVMDKDKNLKDFSFVRINQYGTEMITRECLSACDTLDRFYSERDAVSRMKQRSYDLLKFLANTSDRITRKLSMQREELKECADRDKLKILGDLINANIYKLNRGMESAELENYNDENKVVTVKLNPRLTPSQNAQSYYSEYRKSATAEKKLIELIEDGENELKYIDSVFDTLTRSVTEDEVTALRYELAEQGYIKSSRLKTKMPKEQPPLKYISSDGYTILVGRNNKQNDKLTLKTAEKTDMWLHTQNITGSHVIIQANGENPPDKTIEEAAILAAYNSKARNSSKVPVDYTFVKFVKKPIGSKPGMVIFTNNKTIYVSPDQDIEQKLKV